MYYIIEHNPKGKTLLSYEFYSLMEAQEKQSELENENDKYQLCSYYIVAIV